MKTRILLFAALLLWAGAGQAFPVLVKASRLDALLGADRGALIALRPATDDHGQLAAAVRVPLEIDELEDDGFLVIRQPTEVYPARAHYDHPGVKDPFNGHLRPQHRLVVDDSDFGSCTEACHVRLAADAQERCGAKPASGVELRLAQGARSVFVVNCGATQKPLRTDNQAEYRREERTFITKNFDFTHAAASPALIERLSLKGERLKGQSGQLHGKDHPVFGRSTLKVKLRPRYFFNMNFGEKDLESEVTAINDAEVGVSTEFALTLRSKVASLVSAKQVCCDITVYKDAAYFPIVLELPFNTSSLAKGSTVFYGMDFLGKATDVKSRRNPYSIVQGDETLVLAVRPRAAGLLDPARLGRFITKEEFKEAGIKDDSSNLGYLVDVSELPPTTSLYLELWIATGPASEREQLERAALSGLPVDVRRAF